MSLTARVAPPRYLPGQALHAEWTKFRTVAGPAWLLAGVVALTVAVGVAAASAARCKSATCGIDPATVSFTGIYPAQAVAAVAGVLAAVSKNIQVSEAAGLIPRSRDGQRRPCHLAPAGLESLTSWIDGYRNPAERRDHQLDPVLENLTEQE